ncbi:MAG: lipid-A-disaccharide synthase, partial [Duodenibacillus sp.]
PWADSDRLAVRGYVEVLKKLPGLIRFRHSIIERVLAEKPQLFIGVDAPDFNLGVEMKLRSRGMKTVHFVSPSIWAWRPERIHKIRAAVEHMLLIFPFEEAIYRKEGIPATYVGHPLAGIIPMHPDKTQARRSLGLPEDASPLIAVLPGSRVDEVSGCAPVFFEACERLVRRTGGAARFVLPAVDETRRRQIDAVASHWPQLRERLTIVTGNSHRVLESADGVMVASGTATLEAALYKKPMVVGYTMPGLSAMLMKKKGLIPYVSLPNILAGRALVPELLHYFCTPDALAATLLDEMRPTRAAQLQGIYEEMHTTLLRPTADLACDAIEQVLGGRL